MQKTIVERQFFVKPVAERVVADPVTGVNLASDGGWVDNTKYWRRRMADGDVIVAKPPKKPV